MIFSVSSISSCFGRRLDVLATASAPSRSRSSAYSVSRRRARAGFARARSAGSADPVSGSASPSGPSRPGGRGADAPAAAQILKGVDREPRLEVTARRPARRAVRRRRRPASATLAAARAAIRPGPRALSESITVTVSVVGAELLLRLAGGLDRTRDAPGDVDRDDFAAYAREQRPVDVEEVADQGLRGGRSFWAVRWRS